MKVVRSAGLTFNAVSGNQDKTKEVNRNSAASKLSVEKRVDSTAADNRDAAVALGRLARAASSGPKPVEANKTGPSDIKRKTDEIENAVREATSSTVEELDKLVNFLADEIRANPDEALDAHSDIDEDRVETLTK